MKKNGIGILQLIISIIIYIIFNNYFFSILSFVGLHFTGTAYLIANFIRYLLMTAIIFAIYHKNIRAGQHSFNKTFLNSVIYAVASFVFLMIITILLTKLLNYLGNPKNINIPYNFVNYFNSKFTLNFIFNFIINVLFIPFLLCVIFPLGISNIITKSHTASWIAGIIYGVIYGISLNTTFERAFFLSLIPAITVVLLTYLYKTNHNIWTVIVTYSMYILLGIFVLNYV